MKIIKMHPGDVAIALQLATLTNQRLADIAVATIRSIGEVHNAVRRLSMARLLKPDSRQIVLEPLLGFIRWGVPYAFPAVVGGTTIGVATARMATPDTSVGASTVPGEITRVEFVWPAGDGSARGQALAPLYPNAPQLVTGNPTLFSLLSMVDLIRVGGAREAAAATDAIAVALSQRLQRGAA